MNEIGKREREQRLRLAYGPVMTRLDADRGVVAAAAVWHSLLYPRLI